MGRKKGVKHARTHKQAVAGQSQRSHAEILGNPDQEARKLAVLEQLVYDALFQLKTLQVRERAHYVGSIVRRQQEVVAKVLLATDDLPTLRDEALLDDKSGPQVHSCTQTCR